MFNDKYRLTQAVLEGRKTQTRRILNPTMLFERLNTYEGWTKESIADWKESCKDRLYKAEGEELKEMLDYALEHSLYKVGENVAIAQRYIDLADNDEFYRLCGIHGMPLECIKFEKGCKNKMFVKADLMPNRIRITNIRIERLQDISEEDCLAEGIVDFESRINKAHFYCITDAEIFGLIKWKLRQFCLENNTDTMYINFDNKTAIEIKATGDLLEEIKKEVEEEL